MHSVLNTIEEAIADLKAGKVIIVVDDENRENEGDFLTAAQNVTPEVINFMATHGRGLICAAITEERCIGLGLEMMVSNNTAEHSTAFTVSVDLLGYGCTTGISASDRSKTIQALINPTIKPEEFGKPGHIFPLKAKNGGVLRRAGHTEATVDGAAGPRAFDRARRRDHHGLRAVGDPPVRNLRSPPPRLRSLPSHRGTHRGLGPPARVHGGRAGVRGQRVAPGGSGSLCRRLLAPPRLSRL